MVAQAVGHELDHAGALAAARTLGGDAHRLQYRQQVIAIHLQAVSAAGNAFLGQGLGSGLGLARHRNGPAVVDHAQHQRQLERATGIERGIEIGLGRATIAAGADRDARFATQFEGQRSAGRVQALGGNWHRPGEIVARHLEIIAAFVAAPVQQHLARPHPAHELRAIFAVAGRKHVLGAHARTDADVGGLVTQAGSVGTELAGALQGNRLGVEGAHEQHLPEQLHQSGDVTTGLGQVFAHQATIGPQVLQVFDLETGGDTHLGSVLSVAPDDRSSALKLLQAAPCSATCSGARQGRRGKGIAPTQGASRPWGAPTDL